MSDFDKDDLVFVGPCRVVGRYARYDGHVMPDDFVVTSVAASALEGDVGAHRSILIPAAAVPSAEVIAAMRKLRSAMRGDIIVMSADDLDRIDAYLAAQETT